MLSDHVQSLIQQGGDSIKPGLNLRGLLGDCRVESVAGTNQNAVSEDEKD